jgi:cytoskeletal protein CcmA (bactofilin family)
MFRKEPDKHDLRADSVPVTETAVTADRSTSPDCTPRSVSWVGPTVYFKGEISANESLIIEGEIEGTIRHNSRNLTIGKQGRVQAEIFAKIIDVRGQVNGDIYGEELVHLFSTAVVTGTVHCTRIIMDDGAALNGTVNMTGEVAKPAKTKLALAENENLAKLAG